MNENRFINAVENVEKIIDNPGTSERREGIIDVEAVEKAAMEQEEADREAIEKIQETLIEIPEDLELSKEQATEYKSKYLAEFGRKKPVPTEQEQLDALQQFVDKSAIEQYKKTLLDTVRMPKGLANKFKMLFSLKQRKQALKEIPRELELEKESVARGDNITPIIIGERIFERMHGVDKGDYVHALDQFGRGYFHGPDTDVHGSNTYINVLSRYFNVNRVTAVRYPVALKGSYHAYKSELKTTFITQNMVVKLAESSELIDSKKMSPEDCDKIDPMPVTDPDNSLLSGMAISLLTGSYDRVVKNDTDKPGKNYIIRKDGTCYLFDLEKNYYRNEMFVQKQMQELNNFLEDRNAQKEYFAKYLAKTSVFLSCLPVTDDINSFNKHYTKFPGRLYDDIENTNMLSDENKKILLKALRTEIVDITSSAG